MKKCSKSKPLGKCKLKLKYCCIPIFRIKKNLILTVLIYSNSICSNRNFYTFLRGIQNGTAILLNLPFPYCMAQKSHILAFTSEK